MLEYSNLFPGQEKLNNSLFQVHGKMVQLQFQLKRNGQNTQFIQHKENQVKLYASLSYFRPLFHYLFHIELVCNVFLAVK